MFGVKFILDIFARAAACLGAAALCCASYAQGSADCREDVPWVSLAHQRELAKKAQQKAQKEGKIAPAAKKEKTKRTGRPELSADKFEYATDGSGAMIARGNAQMTANGATLTAGQISYLRRQNAARVMDDVKIESDNYRVITSAADISMNPKAVQADYSRFGTYPLFVEANSVSGDEKKYVLSGSKAYFGEPALGSFNADASKITYDTQTKMINMEDVVFNVGFVPVLYMSEYEMSAEQKFPWDIKVRAMYNGDYGAALQNTVYYTGFEGFDPGFLLDGYTKRSVLVGPALRYDVDSGSNRMLGKFEAGYIHDMGSREILGVNSYGRPIEPDRYFIEFRHNQIIDDKIALTAVVSAWSDEFVTRDFRDDYFYDNQAPDNFVEAMYYGDMWTTSLFTRFAPNNWETVVQRLPEGRIDIQPVELLNTGAYFRAFASAAYLNVFDPYDLVYRDGAQTARIDAYAGIDRPIQLSDWFKITPVAGVRLTSYFDTRGGVRDSNYTRVLGQVGFDAQMDIWGQFDFTSKTMGIDGIRHHITPLVSYRYIPAAEQGKGRFDIVDYDYFTTYPPILDLSSMRNVDDLSELNTMRVGIMNVFETRDADFGSRELARFDVFADLNFTRRAPPLRHKYWNDDPEYFQRYSDVYVNASVSPTRWLTLGTYSRFSFEHSCAPEINTYLRLMETDIASLTIGSVYLKDSLEQYFMQIEYSISQRYRLFASLHYDAELSEFVYQRYGLRTKIGTTWIVDYFISHRSGSTREDSFSFGVNIIILGM